MQALIEKLTEKIIAIFCIVVKGMPTACSGLLSSVLLGSLWLERRLGGKNPILFCLAFYPLYD